MEALIVCSAIGLFGWGWLLRRARAGGGLAPTGNWQLGDCVLSGAVAAYFVLSALQGGHEKMPVTAKIIWMSVAIYAAILILLVGAVRLSGASLQSTFGLAPAHPLRAIGIGVLCLALVYPLVELASVVMALFGHPVSSEDGLVQYIRGRPAPGDLAVAVGMAVVIAPVIEELLFRGYLYGILKKFGGRTLAAIVSAAIFAASHPNPSAYPSLFLLAVALAFAYEFTGSLWTSIVMHMLFNSVTVIAILWFPEWIH